ncbi:fibronectin type III domain-containing protein [bacterium]|nr:fibronectin type III domain-containing protein [bacterium]
MFGKLMLGSSVTRYPPEVVEIIGRSLPMPMTGRSARPVGLFAGCDEEGAPNPEVYHYACGGDDHILLFWNHSGESDNYIRAELGRPPAFGGVEVQSDLDYDVWDFWDWRYVGRVAGRNTLTLSVRPAEMKTLMLRPVRPHPYLLSTNRHVLQGEIDAHSVTWDEATRTLSGAFDVVARDRYRAVLKLPDSRWQVSEWTLEASDAVGRQLRHDRQAAWVELSIDSPENARLAWSVKFALAEAPSPAPAPAQASQGEPAPNLEPPSARLTSIQPGDGDWQGRCGRQGYLLPSYNGEGEDAVRLPTYISAVHWGENAAGWVFARATSDARALPLPDASGRRLGAVFARNTLDVYIETTDRAPHAVTLYCVDFDRRGRRQRLVVLDPGTLRPISPAATLEDFQEGVYAEVVISGSAIVRLTNLAPYDSARNAVLSGVFFDSPTPRPPQAFRLHEPQLAAERAYRLSWEPSPGAEFYRLLVFDGKGNSVVDEVLRETSYEVKGLSAGKSYRWSVEARNHDGVGAPLGEPASFVARFPAPARAEWLGADRDTGSNWQNVYGKAGYVLFAGGPDGPADVVHLPAFIASATATGERVNWRDGVLSGSYTCAFDQIMLHVTAKDRRAHRMTLAFASGQGCNSGIEIWDPHYETLLCRAWVAAPRGETRYVSFDVAGDVRVVLSRNRDCFPKNALLSAVYWE